MNQNENIGVNEQIAPWMRTAAFNNYWTYSFVSRASYYAMIPREYYDFMNRFVQNWLWWYDGWVPYFHSEDKGIPSTRIGAALVNKAARKVVGGRVMFKNAGKDSTSTDVNPALEFISGKWAVETDFEEVVKDATRYAAAAGTALIKLNKREDGRLWAEALRFDSFLPTIGASGEVEDVKCFLRCFTSLSAPREGEAFDSFYVVEHRYYDDYQRINGEIIHRAPLVSYRVYRQSGSITNGQYLNISEGGAVPFSSLPKSMRKSIGGAFAGIRFDAPMLLPFHESLGCEIVKWSSGVSALPELPFGESFLSPIISQLMSWDYYNAAANTDMYLGRGRVMLPKPMQNPKAGENYNAGFDNFSFTSYPSNPAATDKDTKPTPIQFELRAGDWSEIRNRLIQDISINTGLNISTIASFVNDSTAARTAREISTEENETAEYVNDQRAILEKPLNRILKLVTMHEGFTDTVVIRWSAAGLTNRFALAEILQMGLTSGFLSQYKAVQMFNVDDDVQQVQEEYERIKEESKGKAFDMDMFPDQNPYEDSEEGLSDDRGEETESVL